MLKENFEVLSTKEDAPELSEYDQLLIDLNALLFESTTLIDVRTLYDNCSYILEMA